MAKKCLTEKVKREPRFKVRRYKRCELCGRRRGYMRRFKLCRICFRELASRGHYPAVDILSSVSRLMNDVASPRHRELATKLRTYLADYEEAKDLVHVGAYVRGSNVRFDNALDHIEAIQKFLIQSSEQSVTMEQTVAQLARILK